MLALLYVLIAENADNLFMHANPFCEYGGKVFLNGFKDCDAIDDEGTQVRECPLYVSFGPMWVPYSMCIQ